MNKDMGDITETKDGAKTLVNLCAGLKTGERALIITDPQTKAVGLRLESAAQAVSEHVTHVTIELLRMHGQEPPDDVARQMSQSDVIFGLIKMSVAHTQACRTALKTGARYLGLPHYTLDLLSSPSLAADFKALTPTVEYVTEILNKGQILKITSELGTDIKMDIKDRKANSAPGWCSAKGTLSSPPDVESNIAPLEDGSEGVLVIDGSIPCRELGVLNKLLKVVVRNGRIAEVIGEKSEIVTRILDSLNNPLTRVLAEVGFGLNPKAVLRGVMLEDEGCMGTVHFGFGSNMVLGGKNQVPFHLDMVMRSPTVTVDSNKLYDKGRLVR